MLVDTLHDNRHLRETRRRLAAVSLVVAAAVAAVSASAAVGFNLLDWPAGGAPPSPLSSPLPLLPASLAVFALTRWRRFPNARVLHLAGAYQFVGAIVLALSAHWHNRLESLPAGFFSWLAVWILLFPLVVPRGTPRDVGGALACAALAPLVVFAHDLHFQLPAPAPHELFKRTHPYFVCALLAARPAILVRRLGDRARRERRARRNLGGYRLFRQLTRGGMGEVWLAEHHFLVRPAAVKLIREAALADVRAEDRARVLARFEREAQETALLTSPHTVTIYDFGRTTDGAFFCAMELLDGLNLEDLVVRHGPLPPARIVHLLRQACASLAEAHARGLIHRDVKPANLFACQQGLQHDVVKVLDFGLVTTSEEQGRSTRLSDAHTIVGTPLCMAPEQVQGDTLDERVDIYALGCVAYYLLTSRYPFDGETPLAILLAHSKDQPTPPSHYTPCTPELDSLILDCLAKSPTLRPYSALALSRRLAALPLPDTWSDDDATAWWEQHTDSSDPPSSSSLEPTLLLPDRLRQTTHRGHETETSVFPRPPSK